VRHLGSSVGLFVCAVVLRERFKEILHKFRNHSSIVFPALRQTSEESLTKFRSESQHDGDDSNAPELGSILSTLQMLARDLEKFLDVRSAICSQPYLMNFHPSESTKSLSSQRRGSTPASRLSLPISGSGHHRSKSFMVCCSTYDPKG